MALLDLRLPDMEGTKLLTEMRMGTPRMRTIMITGYPTLETAIEALNLGADAYMIKPIEPRRLLNVIEKKLEEQEVERYNILRRVRNEPLQIDRSRPAEVCLRK